MVKTLVFIVCVVTSVVWGTDVALEVSGNSTGSNDAVQGKKSAIDIYLNLFKMKRKEHIRAVETVLLMDDVQKQHKMIGIMLDTIVKTITHGQDVITKAGYKAGDNFPENVEIKDGLSTVLENTALLTDLLVRFPFISQNELKTKPKAWADTVKWAKNICEKSGVFIGKHEKILHSLGQEMGIDDPDPEYSNPFKVKPEIDTKTSEEKVKEYEEKKRKEKLDKRKKNKKSGNKKLKNEL